MTRKHEEILISMKFCLKAQTLLKKMNLNSINILNTLEIGKQTQTLILLSEKTAT